MAGETPLQAVTCYSPADQTEKTGCYEWANSVHVDAAVTKATASFTSWKNMPLPQRSRLVSQWLETIEGSAEQLAAQITQQQGKPLREANAEIGKSLREARMMIAFAANHGGYELPSSHAEQRNLCLRRPLGAIAAICPWNFPVMTPLRKVVPALLVGNTALLKPSEYTPAAALTLVKLADGILPDGVLQYVCGGADVAAQLVAHHNIKAVAFTGSVTTGQKIAAVAGANLTPVSLELGGKNAAILDRDCDLPAVLEQVFAAALQCAGQRCTAISRLIVHESHRDRVIELAKTYFAKLIAGDGRIERTSLGPITTAGQLKAIEGIVERAVSAGAELLLGGKRFAPDASSNGLFFQPTLLGCSNLQNPAVQEEVFGPVLTLETFNSPEEAIEKLNATKFGLTAALFSNDRHVQDLVQSQAEVGMLHINHGTTPDDNMPFIGTKNSGLGTGSVGRSSLDFFTREQSIYQR